MNPLDPAAVALARLEAKMDAIREDVTEIKKQTTETNGRVRKLEAWRAWLTGALAALGLAGPVVAALIADRISN